MLNEELFISLSSLKANLVSAEHGAGRSRCLTFTKYVGFSVWKKYSDLELDSRAGQPFNNGICSKSAAACSSPVLGRLPKRETTGCSLLWTRRALSDNADRPISRPLSLRLLLGCARAWYRCRSWHSSHSPWPVRIQGGGFECGLGEAPCAEFSALPDALYRLDRFRAIRGRVTDDEGKPVSRALVRCVKVESLVEVAKAGTPAFVGLEAADRGGGLDG